MVKLSQTDYEKMVAHAESELPDEACGLIAGRIDGDDKIIEKVYLLTNIDHSNEHFSLDPKGTVSSRKGICVKWIETAWQLALSSGITVQTVRGR